MEAKSVEVSLSSRWTILKFAPRYDDVVEVELGGFRSLYRVERVGEGIRVDGDDFRGAGVLCERALDHAVEQGVGAENFRILGG